MHFYYLGCLIEDELIGVGEVRYVNGAAQACEHKDGVVDLGVLSKRFNVFVFKSCLFRGL